MPNKRHFRSNNKLLHCDSNRKPRCSNSKSRRQNSKMPTNPPSSRVWWEVPVAVSVSR